MTGVTAILLAAGQSKRMGTNKLLLEVGEKTLVERMVDVLSKSRVDRIIVVVGFEADRVRERLAGRDVDVVFNHQYREGMAGSIRAGLRWIGRGSNGVLIALADHPLLTPETIDRLIDGYRRTEKGIVCPTYRGERGHPVIFNLRKYGEALSKLEGDMGGKGVVETHRDDVLEIAVDSPGVIRDIDRWEDYQEFQRLVSQELNRDDEEGAR